MSEYWTSTKAPVHLFKKEYESKEAADYLTENSFVDPHVLAQDLKKVGLHGTAVKAYQRKLGVRQFAPANPRYPRKKLAV